VTFDETKILKAKESQPAKEPIKEAETIKEKMNLKISDSSVQLSQVQHDGSQVSSDSDVSNDENVEEQSYSLVKDRSRREIKPPSRYDHSDFAYYLVVAEEVEFGEPSNYKEVVASYDTAKWKTAIVKP
jgi:hypothetical protein